MKTGLSSWSYSWSIGISEEYMPSCPMDAESLLSKAVELGAQVLQIADNCPLHRLSSGKLALLGEMAAENGIRLEVGTRGISSSSLLPYLDIAEALQAPLVRTLLHDDRGCPSLQQARSEIIGILPQLEKRKLILAIENHDFFKTADLAELIREINHPLVGICLDPVNNLAQGESTTEVLKNLGSLSVNFHCKDYIITRKPSMMGFDVSGCAAGDGLLDIDRCAGLLPRDISYIVELWTPWQGELQKTVELERKWAERSLRFLKNYMKRTII